MLDQKLVEKLVREHTNLVLRGTGSLSSSVDCCYSNLLDHDLLRVKTRGEREREETERKSSFFFEKMNSRQKNQNMK